MKLQIRIKQGRGGKWRWHLYEDGAHAGMSSIRGVATYDAAVASAKRHFGEGVEIILSSGNPDMDWPLYAGARDWAD